MKVTLDTPSSQNISPPVDPIQSAGAVAGRRDFASVLNDTLKSADASEQGQSGSSRHQPAASDRSVQGDRADSETQNDTDPAQPKDLEHARTSEEQPQTVQSAPLNQGLQIPHTVTPATDGIAVPATSILHPLDLAHLVTAARTQLLPNGTREITIDLHRSVLEGLRVRVTSDAHGRIGAEFLAANDSARSHVDARAGELSEMFRCRGIKLHAFKSSLASSSSDAGGSRHREHHQPAVAAADPVLHNSGNLPQGKDTEEAGVPDPVTGITYRA